jgi:hypothetical protein
MDNKMNKVINLTILLLAVIGITYASDATVRIAKVVTYADGSSCITVKQINEISGDYITETSVLYLPDLSGSQSNGFVGSAEGIKKLYATALLAYENQVEVRLGYRSDNGRFTITYLTVR